MGLKRPSEINSPLKVSLIMYFEILRQYKSGIFLNPIGSWLSIIQLLLGWQCKNLWKELRAVGAGDAGGSKAPPHFGRSGNPTQQEGGLWQPHYYLPPGIFRPFYGRENGLCNSARATDRKVKSVQIPMQYELNIVISIFCSIGCEMSRLFAQNL